jgi:hypothetical protein
MKLYRSTNKLQLRVRPWTPKGSESSLPSLSTHSTGEPLASRLVQIWLKREQVLVGPQSLFKHLPHRKSGL